MKPIGKINLWNKYKEQAQFCSGENEFCNYCDKPLKPQQLVFPFTTEDGLDDYVDCYKCFLKNYDTFARGEYSD